MFKIFKKFGLKEFGTIAILSILGVIISSIQLYAEQFNKNVAFNRETSTVLGVVSGKEGYKLRYTTTTNGGLVFTGNSLCLSESTASHGSCGTFTSLNSGISDPDFTPQTMSTTANWQENGASSNLNLPVGSEVLYAELIWGGSYKYLNQDLSSELDSSITLQTPAGQYQVSGASDTGGNIASNSTYVRSQNVTELIRAGGSGTYSLSGVPAIMVKNNPYNNTLGYTIAVAFRDDNQVARNLSIFVGAEQVGADQLTNTAEVTGFSTPTNGDVKGRLFVSANEGDNMYQGDRMRFGGSPDNLQDLAGPNNQVDNFFASQINGQDGNLDTTGTFGNKNQSINGGNQGGVRQGWDVTSVDISNQLNNGQTAAYAQGYSTGDSYVINGLGMQIDVNSAYPETIISFPGNPRGCVGDIVDVQMAIKNQGSATSLDTIITELNLPTGLTMIPGSFKINNADNSETLPINLGDLNSQQEKIVTFKVQIPTDSTATSYQIRTKLGYRYEMTPGNFLEEVLNAEETLSVSTNCGQELPPTAVDDTKPVKQNTPTTINVLANDTDEDGQIDPSTLEITENPNNGQVTIIDGQIVYTPNQGYVGSDTFDYEICDNDGLCDTATVTITVNPIYPPIAQDDQKNGQVNTPIIIASLDNDSDQDSEPSTWTYELISSPTNGTATFNGQEVVYTPNQGYVGSDTFDYEICDNDGLCDTATITVNIASTTELIPPVAEDDSGSTFTNVPAVINFAENDSDADGTLDIPGVTITSQPTKGVVTIQGESFIYTPNPGTSGTDTFDYEICDNDGLCDTATVTIEVIPNNQIEPTGPIAEDVKAIDDGATTKESEPVNIKVTENDQVTNPETVTVTIPPQNGSTVVKSDLTIDYTPKPGFVGSDRFSYQVCNDKGCAIAVVTVTVEEEQGRVLGDFDNLIRTGGGNFFRLIFFVIVTGIAIFGVIVSLNKKPEAEDDYVD